jgi:hypothetical protein
VPLIGSAQRRESSRMFALTATISDGVGDGFQQSGK